MPDIRLNWSLGIDNISDKTRLPYGAVTDAANVDIDRAGQLSRRSGRTSVASVRSHSIWTSSVRGDSFAVVDGALSRVQMPWAATNLLDLAHDAQMSFCDLNGDVIASTKHDLLSIGPDFSVRGVGIENPGAPRVTATDDGGLTAGDYGVAISYLAGNEEGGLSRIAFVTLTEGQGMGVIIPQPLESIVTKVRVYRTQPNGDVLYRIADVGLNSNVLIGEEDGTGPIITESGVEIALGDETATVNIGVSLTGRQANNYGLQRMIPGDFVRAWRGLLWTVRANVMYHSEPLRYGLYDPKFNFVQDANRIRMFEPVEGGIHYGTKDGTFFLSGSGPKEFSVRRTGGRAPIPGTGRRINGSLLKEGAGEVAIWLSSNGFVIGNPDGSLSEPQTKRITLSGNSGAIVVHDARVLAVVQ